MRRYTNTSIQKTLKNKFKLKWKNIPEITHFEAELNLARPNHDKRQALIEKWEIAILAEDLPVNKVLTPKHSRYVPKLVQELLNCRSDNLIEAFCRTPDMFESTPGSVDSRKIADQEVTIVNQQLRDTKTSFINNLVKTTVHEGSAVMKINWDYAETGIEVTEELDLAKEPEDTLEGVPEVVSGVVPEGTSEDALGGILGDIPEGALEGVPESDSLSHLAPKDLSTTPEYAQHVQAMVQSGEMTPEEAELVMSQDPAEETFEIPEEPSNTTQDIDYTQQVILKNKPVIDVISVRDFYIDPECTTNLDDAKFVIQKITTDLYQLKAAGKYENLDLLAEDINKTSNYVSDSEREHTINSQPICIYEYWGYYDTKGDGSQQSIIATWCNDIIIRLEVNSYPGAMLPFAIVQYSQEAGTIHGQSDAELIDKHQRVVGALYRGILNIFAHSSSGQVGTAVGFFPNNREATKFNNLQPYNFNATHLPERAIHLSTFNEVPTSIHQFIQQQEIAAYKVVGLNPPMSEQPGQAGRTDLMGKKEVGVLRRISAGFLNIAKKIIVLNSTMLASEDKAGILGLPVEEVIQFPVNHTNILDNIILEISTPEYTARKLKDLTFLLQTIGPNSPPEVLSMLMVEFSRLSDMPDFAYRLENFQPAPDPQQEEAIGRQIQKELADIRVTETQADSNIATAENLRAKAEETYTGADKKTREAEKITQDIENNSEFAHLDRAQEIQLQKQQGTYAPTTPGANTLEQLEQQLKQ